MRKVYEVSIRGIVYEYDTFQDAINFLERRIMAFQARNKCVKNKCFLCWRLK
jgi:hypothetical protein